MNARNLSPLASLALICASALGCTAREEPPPPAPHDGGVVDAGPADAGQQVDAGPPVCDPGSTIGTACSSSADCDDGCFCNGVEVCVEGVCEPRDAPCRDEFDCTVDGCDEENDRCEFVGDDSRCDDGDYCNGAEECVPGVGCRSGLRPVCNDGDPCTVGACDSTLGCVYTLRDLDGDGYADDRCGGTDCNDDPVLGVGISPAAHEVCDNGYDDDCNGLADYRDPACAAPNDTCDTAELLPGPGSYVRTTRGATSHHPTGCAPTGVDTVFRFTLDAAADVNVSVAAESGTASVAIRPASSCATGPDTYCRAGDVLARDLAPGEYAIIVRTPTGTNFTLTLERLAPTPIRPVDVCNEATLDITAGGRFEGFFSDVNHDYTLACHATSTAYKDVAFRIVLTEPSDVRLTASTNAPSEYLSLVRDCTSPETALACLQRNDPEITRRSLAPGVYYVLLEPSTTSATSWSLTADIQPAAMRSPGDACPTAIDITNATVDVPIASLEMDYGTTCPGGTTTSSRDASFTFTTTELSDVVLETEAGAVHYVSITTDCGDLTTETSCTSGTPRVSQRLLRVEPGTYHVTVTTAVTSGTIRASARIEPPTFAPDNDTCAGAETFGDLVDAVPATGNLLAAADDLQSCAAAGSPDAIHRLVLTERKNVTVVARRTDGGTEPLSVGLRSTCDGSSDLACGSGASALLNRTLDAGTYYLVVESPRGSVGPYSIVAYFADP